MANKLELTWVGKEKELKIEPRILIKNPALSNTKHDEKTENMLIHGDNLLALKALESKYAGKVKCIYIDPPYNTGSAFEHYDDNLEHSIWLGLMKPRLEILRNLLSDDGSLWISIDDDEQAYLKVLCDEVFGRGNFVCNVIWQKKHTRANDAKWFSDTHDFIMVYARDKEKWKRNLLPRTQENIEGYSNPDNDPRGVWQSLPLQAKSGSDVNFVHVFRNGVRWKPPKGRFSAFAHSNMEQYSEIRRILLHELFIYTIAYFVKNEFFGKAGYLLGKTYFNLRADPSAKSFDMFRCDYFQTLHDAMRALKGTQYITG